MFLELTICNTVEYGPFLTETLLVYLQSSKKVIKFILEPELATILMLRLKELSEAKYLSEDILFKKLMKKHAKSLTFQMLI